MSSYLTISLTLLVKGSPPAIVDILAAEASLDTKMGLCLARHEVMVAMSCMRALDSWSVGSLILVQLGELATDPDDELLLAALLWYITEQKLSGIKIC